MLETFWVSYHKRQPKRLSAQPQFKPLKRKHLPRPLHQVGGTRLYSTGLLELGGSYEACFIWRDGSLLADTAFYAWLFLLKPDGGRYPLASLHYHPSHKPVHLLTPCRMERDLTDRQMPGATEFDVSHDRLDPREEFARSRLIEVFCERCGIAMGEEGLFDYED